LNRELIDIEEQRSSLEIEAEETKWAAVNRGASRAPVVTGQGIAMLFSKVTEKKYDETFARTRAAVAKKMKRDTDYLHFLREEGVSSLAPLPTLSHLLLTSSSDNVIFPIEEDFQDEQLTSRGSFMDINDMQERLPQELLFNQSDADTDEVATPSAADYYGHVFPKTLHRFTTA